MDPIPIFIGYDPKEAVAYHVCCQSILARSSVPVAFHPLHLGLLKGYEESHSDGSNAFIYSRFLVPWMMKWKGFAIFMDGDMIVKDDIANLWNQRDYYKAIQVVKHDYRTKHPIKYLGTKNEDYPRKNWSSVILWNCGHFGNRDLVPEAISKMSGSELHRFQWLNDDVIGGLGERWNHLVLEYPDTDASLYHYTIGASCFEQYNDCDRADDWFSELSGALNVEGQSHEVLFRRLDRSSAKHRKKVLGKG